ncbi:MAG TPA: NIPSNAP family protein [Thermoanaerobaculia bacterium]|jgi:hypothetical protein|nr:NIPSNAP family protein [Thermoanaerobaculia bacterium]
MDPNQVIELRQYTLKPGRREVLSELFDRHFVDGQEEAGIAVLGQFHDRRRPEMFVWLRSFPDMEARHRSLERFYGGPIWAAHREAANATMVDSDDVLMLRPARPGGGIVSAANGHGEAGAAAAAGVVLVGIELLREPAGEEVLRLLECQAFPRLRAAGARMRGFYVTEPAKNLFRLPVREGEHAAVWIASVAAERASAALAAIAGENWRREVKEPLAPRQAAPAALLELAPTARSRLRHEAARAR